MSAESDHSVDLDAVLARLRARVDERRASGEYPADLEAELARHAEEVLSRASTERHLDGLAPLAEAVGAARHFALVFDDDDVSSRFPGGVQAHRLITRSAARLDEQVAEALRRHAEADQTLARAVVEEVLDHQRHTHARLDARLDTVADETARLRRQLGATEAVLDALVARIVALEAGAGLRTAGPVADGAGATVER